MKIFWRILFSVVWTIMLITALIGYPFLVLAAFLEEILAMIEGRT